MTASEQSCLSFPPEFLWGAATSSHQVEGDNQWNEWWEYEQTGRLPYKSGAACRHYSLYEQDFDLARAWGHKAHRFSIEWSRIEPVEGRWNPAAMTHYRAVIQALRQRNLEPIVTLHHFTNPAWFIHRGGWLRRDSAQLFARYVTYVAEHLGAAVKYWLTMNEPTVYVEQGYLWGEWPPCIKLAWFKAARVFTNLARAHVLAYRVLHRRWPDVWVSFAHSAPLMMPCDPQRRRDRFAAALRGLLWHRAFFWLIQQGRRSARSLDFIGLNYYTRTIVRSTGWGLGALVGRACYLPHHRDRGPMSTTGWEVYPLGLRAVLEQFARFALPIMITENGVATDNETLRRDFLLQHLQHLAQAVAHGIPVIGYLYWALMDNFEWTLGTAARFGLAAVDFQTQQRLPRPCVEDFMRVCRNNSIMLSYDSRHE